MSLQKALRVLDRFRGKPEVWIREAIFEDLPVVTPLVIEWMHEVKLPVSDGAYARVYADLQETLETANMRILLAMMDGEPAGMICAGFSTPDVWDGLPAMNVWYFHVSAAHRGSPHVALALMRRALEAGQEWGAKKLRACIEEGDQSLLRKSERMLGMKRELHCEIFALDMED